MIHVVRPPELPTDLPRVVREALECLIAPFRPLLAAHGLTEQQWRVLRALGDGAASQVALARACVMAPASLTGVLARMERDGLIVRRRSTEDQRRVVVSTTAAGRELVARLAPEIEARYGELTQLVGSTTLAALERAATAVRDATRGPGHAAVVACRR